MKPSAETLREVVKRTANQDGTPNWTRAGTELGVSKTTARNWYREIRRKHEAAPRVPVEYSASSVRHLPPETGSFTLDDVPAVPPRQYAPPLPIVPYDPDLMERNVTPSAARSLIRHKDIAEPLTLPEMVFRLCMVLLAGAVLWVALNVLLGGNPAVIFGGG
jgi:hypothetical protein